MPLVAGGLLISVLLLLQVFGLLSLHRTSLPLVRGLLGGWAEQKGFRKWFLRAIGVNALANAIEWVVHRVREAVARAAAANMDAATLYLRDLGVVAHYTYKELGAIVPSWADSFGLFRHHTLPRLLHTAVAPAAHGATVAGRLAGRSISLGNANRIRLGRSIDRLKKEVGLLAGILIGIDILVKRGHALRHHADHTRTIPAQTKELADHRARLKRIEKALGLGVIAGLVYKVLARVAPWLFCRNWKVLGRAVCGMRPDTLNTLLGLLLGVFALSDLRRTAKIAEDALDLVTGIVWDAAQIGDRPSGRFTID